MTPNEFKAWFDGFTEAFNGRMPTSKQWTRIIERVAEIDGKAITERVFVDRWWPYIHQALPQYVPWYSITGGSSPCISTTQNAQNVQNFDAPTAMYALGKADAVLSAG